MLVYEQRMGSDGRAGITGKWWPILSVVSGLWAPDVTFMSHAAGCFFKCGSTAIVLMTTLRSCGHGSLSVR